MNRFHSALLILIPAAAVAAPGADEMARCASITAPEARLACYDAAQHRPADKGPPEKAPTAPVQSPTRAPASAPAPA
ncbi:MAG: type VI secretion protein, partial [Pseudomonadota bacterium]|nr:type VI secretion protein [Pseudomonadota bacterium]